MTFPPHGTGRGRKGRGHAEKGSLIHLLPLPAGTLIFLDSLQQVAVTPASLWLLCVLLFAEGGVKSRRKEEKERWTEREISTESIQSAEGITNHVIRG